MDWRIAYAHERKRVALMVSREDHCLLDLLWRWRRGELEMDIVGVVSNHEPARDEVEALGVPVPPRAGRRGTRSRRPRRSALELLAGHVDLVVLARYMQILSAAIPRAASAAR